MEVMLLFVKVFIIEVGEFNDKGFLEFFGKLWFKLYFNFRFLVFKNLREKKKRMF